MMNEERGKWEDVIHSKLYDFEAETNPEDWEALSAKLSGGKTVRLIPYRKILFTAAAAAAVIVLVVIGGLYIFSGSDDGQDTRFAIENQIPQIEKEGEVVENPVENVVEKPVENLIAAIRTQEKKTGENDLTIWEEEDLILPTEVDEADQKQDNEIDNQPVIDEFPSIADEIVTDELTIDQPQMATITSVAKRRRWGFGVGGGGITVGSTSGSPTVARSRLLRPDEYTNNREEITLRRSLQNATLIDPVDGIDFQNDDTAGKIKHKTPVSGGLGVSYYLTDRWTLHSGAVYTLLRSKGSDTDDTGNPYKWNQNLHFIGVPLSASYSMAEWKRINFYVTAGGMGEWNVAGKIKRSAKEEGLDYIKNQKLRINQPFWSINSRVGAVYPVWKFVNVYAEAGVYYYFENKSNSDIKRIWSDKPFDISLQAGIRLGF